MKFGKFAPLFVIIAASIWGIDGIVLRPSLYGLPVYLVVLIETALVSLILTPFFISKFSNLKDLRKNDWLAFLGVAIFGGAIGIMAITKALFYVNFVNLSIVILIQKLQPVFAILLASVVLKERPPVKFFGWAVLAIIGAYLMTFALGIPNFSAGDKTTVAALFALLASFSFGSSTVLSKRALRNVGFEMGTFLRFTITSIIMFSLVAFLGELPSIQQVTEKQIYVFIIIAVMGGPAIFLYYYGLKNISASVSTICELSFPLTAVLLEYFIRGNILSGIQWLGVGILLISMIKVSLLQTESH